MNENIKNFIQRVAADESLQAKMQTFTNPDEAYDFAKSIQDGFTKEEFNEVMTKLSESISGSTSDSGELTDEDIANVAGGEIGTATAAGVATATGAVAIGIAAAV